MKYKLYLKAISVVLVVALLLQCVPLSVSAQTEEAVEQVKEEATAYIIGEDISKREAAVKHFRMSDGSYTAAVYPYPVHYENEQGEFADIDNSLDETADELGNKQNSFSVKFMKKSNKNKLYTIDKNGYKIKVSIDGAQAVALEKMESADVIASDDFSVENIGSSVAYRNILTNSDIEFSLFSNQLKENIILKEKVDFNSINYTYHINGSISAVQNDEKTITLYDKDGGFISQISAPAMWDSNGQYSDNIGVELTSAKNSKITVKLYWEVPEDFTYPVTIDPVMQLTADRTEIEDTHIIKSYPNTNYNANNHLRVSHDRYTLIRFPMPELKSGDKVVNAQLVLAPYGAFDSDPLYSNVNSYSPPLYITTHKILRSWNEETATYSNVAPENNFYDSDAQSYRKVDVNDEYYTWDITRLVNEWIEGYSENYGVLLKFASPTSDGSRFDAFFCSTNGATIPESAWPQIVYQYINTSGIEDYYSCHTQSAGYAGTVYTNDFSGNLTLVNNVLTTGGSLMPIDVSLVYNLSHTWKDSAPYGAGWKLNWAQSIDWSVLSNFDDTQYLKYNDGDGTYHFFTTDYSTGIWTDEINPDRKVYFVESTGDYKMTDSSGTNMYFTRDGTSDEWYLYKIEDIYGNYIQIILDPNNLNRVKMVYSSSGSVVDFEYSSYGYLSYLTYKDGEETKRIEIDYNEYVTDHNNGISDIIYADGTRAKYHYHEGTKMLSKAIDIDGQYIYYEYTGGSSPKVDKIAKYDRSGSCEATAELSYSVTSTIFKDVTYDRQYLYTFAQNGTLKSVVDTTLNDGNGYGQYYEFNDGNTTETQGKDRLTFLSKTQKSTVNLLKNHSFEEDGGHSFTAWDETTNTASGSYTTEKKYIGSRSYKITRPASSDCTRAIGFYYMYIEGGKTYTLSAYVNTSDMVSLGKGASLMFIDSEKIYESELITEAVDKWQRLSLTFIAQRSEYVSICMNLYGATGSVYFDNIQLEVGGISDYNLLENAGFESISSGKPDEWVASYERSSVSEDHVISGDWAAKMLVSTDYVQYLSIPDGKKGDTYVASAFAKAVSVPAEDWQFSVFVRFTNDGETVSEHNTLFNSYTTEWQKVSGVAKAEGDYDTIQFWLLYYDNANTAYFDNAQLIKDTFGTTYTYDDKGNLISTVDLQGKEEYTFKYDGNNQLIKETTLSGGKILYTYNSGKEQQLDVVTDGMASTYYDYDQYGNTTTAATYSSTLVDGASYYIQNVYNSRYLTAVDLGYSYGKDANVAKFDGYSSQKWKIIKNTDGSYSISCECEPDKLLSLEFDSLYSENDLILYAEGGRQYQKFDLVKKYGNVYNIVIHEAPEWALDVSEVDSYIYEAHSGEVQQFAFVPVRGNHSAENPAMLSTATYSSNGEYMTSSTDSRGNTVSYEYNEDRGYLKSVTDAKGTKTDYSYYANELLSRVQTGASAVNYSYTGFKELSSITSPSGTVYNFQYDSSGRNTAIKVGTTALSNYVYDSKGQLDTLIYGNGDTVKYGYDALGRQTSTTINNVLRSLVTYDGVSRVAQFNDLLLSRTVKYEYDILDRAVGEKQIDNNTKLVVAQLMLRYDDAKNRISGYDTTVNGTSYSTDYIYGENNNSPEAVTGIKRNGERVISYNYDDLGRLNTRTLATGTPFVTEYSYAYGKTKYGESYEAKFTTPLVETVKNGNDTLEYTYDQSGNITSIAKNGSITDSYEYDSLGQLIKHTMGNTVYEYTYDNGGNILSVTQNGTVKKTLVYGNSQWKDLLTSYNGRQLTYDSIGNPNNWRTGFDFTWSNGRQLTGITKDGNSISYTYDAQGQRVGKNVNGVTTEFYWLNGILQGQKTGSEHIIFLYDENGTAYGMIVDNGATQEYYYYIYNLQGDIIGILDSTGSQVVQYSYDAWGTVLSVTGTMADTIGQKNPLRYRGYYYDTETGFYYCNSRYYDSVVQRFINADGYVSTGQDILGFNMFAYCGNNPVNLCDCSGTCPHNGNLVEVYNYECLWCNPVIDFNSFMMYSEHRKKGTTNPSNRNKHEKGQSRKQRDNNGEKKNSSPNWKPNRNKRNTQNIDSLKEFGEVVVNGIIICASATAIVLIVANDSTVIGVIDDVLLAPIFQILWDNSSKMLE